VPQNGREDTFATGAIGHNETLTGVVQSYRDRTLKVTESVQSRGC
jgi:hypothetical protein